MKRVTQKKSKAEFAAKFISARGKRKAAALREMDLLSDLDHERILYFDDAFEKKNVVVLITELYPCMSRETAFVYFTNINFKLVAQSLFFLNRCAKMS